MNPGTEKKPIITLRNLNKTFDVYRTAKDFAIEFIFRKCRHTVFPALTDINMEIMPGETVGFIGRNGAGKSTLLKIIAGTLSKSSGEIQVKGRIAAILELGTGFNPQYSGRENIYMGGLCLGMSRGEIDRKVDSIIEFSELREFIDQPFKTYSSGMQARLTFATAISVDPDILIVDEALSVGDARFARKCFDRIESFRKAGKTILMVSHDMNTITTFCNRAFLLERGKIVESGDPRYISMLYQKMNYNVSATGNTNDKGSVLIKNSDKAQVLEFGIKDCNGVKVSRLHTGERYTFYLRARFNDTVENPTFGFLIRSYKGVDIFGTDSRRTGSVPLGLPEELHKGDILEGEMTFTANLINHKYFLSAGVGEGNHIIEFHYDELIFETDKIYGIQDASLVNLDEKLTFKINSATEDQA